MDTLALATDGMWTEHTATGDFPEAPHGVSMDNPPAPPEPIDVVVTP